MIDYRWHTSIGFVTALAVMPNVLSDEQVCYENKKHPTNPSAKSLCLFFFQF